MLNKFEGMPQRAKEPAEMPKDKTVEKSEDKEKEKHFERVEMAKMALRDYLALKPDEKVLIIEDDDSKKELVSIIKEALKSKGADSKTFFLDDKKTKEQLHRELEDRGVVLDLSFQMDTHKATKELYGDDLEKYGARLIAFSDLGEGAFDKDGAMAENMQEMNERMNKMEAELSKSKGFHITSNYGTNLEVGMRTQGDRAWSKVNGVVEAEKRVGTMHLAFGSGKHGEEESEGIEDAWSHYDFILPRNGLTVEMFTTEDDFRDKKSANAKKIIDEGRFNLLQ